MNKDAYKGELTLCMMVKNEEKCLLRAIDSVKPIVDEIIIVDTGSNDRTIELAKEAGAKIIEYEWDNDYPKIRNLGLRAATGRWILVLDADEVIDAGELPEMKRIIQNDHVHGYMLIQKSYTDRRTYRGWVPVKPDDPEYGKHAGYISNPICRLFQNRNDIYFENILHELIEPTILKFGGRIDNSNISILHYGHNYFEFKPDKWDNYIASGVKNIDSNPTSARPHRDIGLAMIQAGRYEEAITEFLKGMQKNPDTENLRYNLAVAYNHCNKKEKALEHFSKVRQTDPCYLDAQNNAACLLIELKRFKEAEIELNKILTKEPELLFARFNFAVVSGALHRYSEALEQFLKVEKADPGFPELKPLICQTYWHLGLDAVQNKNIQLAISSFEYVLEREPSHRSALLQLVKQLILLKKLQEADNALKKYGIMHKGDLELSNLHKRIQALMTAG